MSRMQEWLERAARELGLVVRIDVELDLGEGRCVVARAHFPDLGTPMGMLVFRSFAEMGDAERRLFESGYGISVFGQPLPGEAYDAASYAEMFEEWGWTGPREGKPVWMR